MACKNCINMYNALSKVNEYIKNDGTNKKEILKIIHNAMSPKSKEIAHRYTKLKMLKTVVIDLLNRFNKGIYHYYLREIYSKSDWELKESVRDTYTLLDVEMEKVRIKIRALNEPE